MQEPIDPPADAGEHSAAPDGAQARPARERRSRNRVSDNQKTGHGALTALSRLQMIERRRAALDPDAAAHAKDA